MSGTVHAPEIDRPGITWLNVDHPLSLKSLRGRLVILDFWTFCCINCLHILQTLRRVEEAWPEEVVVIGVHSPKFPAERDAGNVVQAIARYGIGHPIAHDPDFQIWRQYGVRAWPTLVFVAPDGHIIGQSSGEPAPDQLMTAITEVLEQYQGQDMLKPARLDLTPPPVPSGRLLFPGKLKPLPPRTPADARQWVLADSGHHQIVVLDDNGREVRRCGSGRPGFADGPAETASFDGPQGLTGDAVALYVADTGNHAVRRIDRATGTVTTLAGTGARGGTLTPGGGPGPTTALASPWDLEVQGNNLFLANAGSHQLGVIDLDTGRVACLAGAGPEGIHDGPAAAAHLAQPSGLALAPDGATLYVADSETSAIRALDRRSGALTTLVGTGLFDFGHANGPFAQARLQHPLGVALAGTDRLLVADTYNNDVRVLDLERREVADFDAGRFTCTDPVCLPLSEPAAIVADGPDRVLVVDTNNHRILEYRVPEHRYRTWIG